MEETIIPKEKAVFRLDKHGFWKNDHGRFRHKKIIDYFHRSIGKDADGYFVSQVIGDRREKVYFPYEDTALFVFDADVGPDVTLTLNTGETLTLDPRNLFTENDALYLMRGDDRIKFTERCLMKLCDRLEDADGQLFFKSAGGRVPIKAGA